MPRRSPSETPADWPLMLRRLIRAAEIECPPGHASAIREFTALALHKVPARGVFDPGAHGEDELFAAIDAVAGAHLELSDARRSWRVALEGLAVSLEQRD